MDLDTLKEKCNQFNKDNWKICINDDILNKTLYDLGTEELKEICEDIKKNWGTQNGTYGGYLIRYVEEMEEIVKKIKQLDAQKGKHKLSISYSKKEIDT